MNESRHLNTYQPLLSAPAELLSHGLRDAHHYPRVGERKAGGGVRSRQTSPEKAWSYPLIEWPRTANSYCSLVLDCDSRESQELALDVVEVGSLDLPWPNVVAKRSASGHLQLGWNLRTPVHRGESARPLPIAAFGRITEYYTAMLRADRRYRGVLSYNPIHGDYQTIYPHSEPYDLSELAKPIPGTWRRPARAVDLATVPGRNCHMLAELCKLALRCSDEGLLTWAWSINREYFIPMDYAEVMGIWWSVCGYRARWRVRGHKREWLWKQATVGRRGGLKSKGGGRPRKWTSEAERLKAFRASHRTETSQYR